MMRKQSCSTVTVFYSDGSQYWGLGFQVCVELLTHCFSAGFSPSPGSKRRLAEGTLATPGLRQDPSLPARLRRHHSQDPHTDGIRLFTCADESTVSLGVKD